MLALGGLGLNYVRMNISRGNIILWYYTLKMETTGFFKNFVILYQIIRRHMREDSYFNNYPF